MLDLMPDLTQPAGWLPLVFALVMALAMLARAIAPNLIAKSSALVPKLRKL